MWKPNENLTEDGGGMRKDKGEDEEITERSVKTWTVKELAHTTRNDNTGTGEKILLAQKTGKENGRGNYDKKKNKKIGVKWKRFTINWHRNSTGIVNRFS